MKWKLATKEVPENQGWYYIRSTKGKHSAWFNGQYFELPDDFKNIEWLDENIDAEGGKDVDKILVEHGYDPDEISRKGNEIAQKHLDAIWQKTKEAQIKRFIEPMFGSLEAASIQHFLETGTISGSFYLKLMAMMDSIRNWSTPKEAASAVEEKGEWQLCPKCNGDGHLGRYNSPNMSTTATPICDVCYGSKILVRPVAPPKEEVDAIGFANWLSEELWIREPFPRKDTGRIMWARYKYKENEKDEFKTTEQLYKKYEEQRNMERNSGL